MRLSIAIVVIVAAACERSEPRPTPKPRVYSAGPFAIPEVRFAPWELHTYAPDSGLGFSVKGGSSPYSTFDIKTDCAGYCKHEQLAAQIQQSAQQLHASLSEEGCVARWVRPLAEIRKGVWAFHLESTGAPACTEAFVEVDYIDDRVRDRFLSCTARLFPSDVALAPAVFDMCSQLPYRVGDGDPALEVIFAHQLPMLGDRVFVPAIDGWRFDNWNTNNGFVHGEVRMESIAGTSAAFVKRHACARCDEAKRMEAIAAERGSRPQLQNPNRELAAAGPNLWFERYAVNDQVVVFGAAISATTSGFVTCHAALHGEDLAHADRVERFCRTVLERWRDR